MISRTTSSLVRSLLFLLPLGICLPAIVAQVSVQGQWTTLPNTIPINPIHAALLPNVKVLVVTGSGNCPPLTDPNNTGELLLFEIDSTPS